MYLYKFGTSSIKTFYIYSIIYAPIFEVMSHPLKRLSTLRVITGTGVFLKASLTTVAVFCLAKYTSRNTCSPQTLTASLKFALLEGEGCWKTRLLGGWRVGMRERRGRGGGGYEGQDGVHGQGKIKLVTQ